MILYAAKKSVEMFGSAVMGNKERYRNDPDYRNYRRLLVGGVAIGTSLGLVAGANNTAITETVTNSVESGEATVQYIDRTLSEQHVIGFTTKVDGAYAEQVIERRGWFDIELPDLTNGVTVDNYVVNSSLCFDGGDKRIKETTQPDGERHYEVRIDPADINVCSKQDPNELSVPTPSASWAENINNMDNDFKRMLKDNLDLPISDNTIIEENELKAELIQAAQNKALYQVNTECAPEVFEETQDDIAELIAEDVKRSDDETVEVIFDVDADGEVKISGQSELDEFFETKVAAGWNMNPGTLGDCEIPETVLEGEDERAQ